MEQVQLQARAVEAAGPELIRRGAAAAGMGGDAFLAIFQHMMEGLAGETAGVLTPEGGQENQEQDPDAMAMMGELAGMGLMQAAPLPDQSGAAAQTAGDAVSAIQEDAGQNQSEAPLTGAERAERRPERENGPQTRAAAFDIPVAEARYTEHPAEKKSGGAGIQAEGQFRSAVEEAKRQMSAPEKKAEPAAETVEGSQVRPQPRAESAARSEKPEEAPPLAQQLDKGISEQLELGKKEFTLKLKPASLGEITVRLVEKEGRTTLSIVTASSETARTINSGLEALREAVRPMAVEVQAAVPKAPENAQTQQFAMGGQQFAQQFQQQRQSFYHGTPGGYAPAAETAESGPAAMTASAVRTGLDAYI